MTSAFNVLAACIQFVVGLLFAPLVVVAAVRWFIRPPADPEQSVDTGPVRFLLTLALVGLCVAGGVVVGGFLYAANLATVIVVLTAQGPDALQNPAAILKAVFAGFAVFSALTLALTLAGYLLIRWQGTETRAEFQAFGLAVWVNFLICDFFFRRLPRFGGTVLLLGVSLLPLSALLLAFPAVAPQEAVLTDAVPERQSWLRRTARRLGALALGLTVLLALLAMSVELVSRLPLKEKGSFAVVARTFLPSPQAFVPLGKTEAEANEKLKEMTPDQRAFWTTPLYQKLPPAMVEHWPFVILGVYLLDLGVLLLLGNVPLNYNLRNVRVRWKTNLMTAVSFTAVIALLSFLLAFVNGMNSLTQNSGIPGNVLVLSDGATDEILSNLGYGDIDNVKDVRVAEAQLLDSAGKPAVDANGQELWRVIPPVTVREDTINGTATKLASKETYYSINMPIPNTDPPRRRFVSVRSIDDAEIAARVHSVELYPKGKWWGKSGEDGKRRIECVIGEGIAGTLGADLGKRRLDVGDEFGLGDGMTWVVTGVMRSEGKTFGSEIWVKRSSRIYTPFGKEKFTTLVLRTDADTLDAAQKMATWLTRKYTQQKLKAFAEPDYYAELAKTNNTFLVAIVVVCVVMAVGGVFGMMTTMFASIAQRIRDIGVLRLLGFKRWQVMVSFLLESLAVALVGGALGVFLAWFFADGRESVSQLSAGGGGPGGKSVALKISVDAEVAAMGLLFTLVMGRLGGLVPALGAMRMKILDSLR